MKHPIASVLAAFALALACTPSWSQDGHKHGDVHKPKHGGLVKEVKDIQYELVAKPDAVTLYLEDHGKKVDSKGSTGKVTFRMGADRSEATLAPAGDNKLEGKGAFKLSPGTTVIVQVKRPGQAEESVRFTFE